MCPMERVGRLIFSFAGVSFLAFAAGLFLAGIKAGIGWYYAAGLLLTGLVVFRTLVPSAGISVGWIKRLTGKDHTRLPHPTA